MSEDTPTTSHMFESPQYHTRWLKNIASVMGVRIVGHLLPLATFPIVVRVLGPEVYGKWVYVQTLVSFTALLANPGLRTYGLREVAADREKAREMVSLVISILIILGFLAYFFLAGFVIVLPQDTGIRWLTLLLGLGVVVRAISGLDWVFAGLQRFDRMAGLQLIAEAVLAGGIVLILRQPHDVFVLPVLSVLGSIIAGLWGWRWLYKQGIRCRIRLDLRPFCLILRVSLFYGFARLMSLIYGKADHLILAWMKGNAILGQYGAAYRLMGALMSFVLVGTTVFVPFAVHISAKEPRRFAPVIRRGLLVMIAISAPVATLGAMMGDEIVSWALGSAYESAGPIFRMLTPVIPLGVLGSFLTGSLLYAPGHYRQYATAVSMAALTNTLLNLLLIPSMGTTGAALATAIAQGTVVLAAVYMGRQYLKGVFIRSLLHPPLASGFMLLVLFAIPSGTNILAKGLISTLGYIGFLWIFDMIDGRELTALCFPSLGRGRVIATRQQK